MVDEQGTLSTIMRKLQKTQTGNVLQDTMAQGVTQEGWETVSAGGTRGGVTTECHMPS